ncbi:MAG: sugar transferase [Terracidiphilus sp.]
MDSALGQHKIDFADALSFPLECHDESAEEFREPAWERPSAETASLESDDRILVGDSVEPDWHGLSSWSRSPAKRLFDCACVVLAMPLLVPLLLLISVVVRLTSRGPILFLQERVGHRGQIFKIIKFRTMEHLLDAKHHPITTADNQRFTPIGPFLRRCKLDELPQVVNVLLGHMSMVGPRPKLPEHVISVLPCRPGITGMATILFASEEAILARIPKDRLKAYYHAIVLPMKQQLDADYMARATFLSDLQILVKSVLRRWGGAAFDNLVVAMTVASRNGGNSSKWPSLDGMPRRISPKNLADGMGISGYFAD